MPDSTKIIVQNVQRLWAEDRRKRPRDSAQGVQNIVNEIKDGDIALPIVAGADIRTGSGGLIQRAGVGVLLFSGTGTLLAEYEKTLMGLHAALGEASVGDVVELPAGVITGTVVVPTGVVLKGMSWASVINGTVYLEAQSRAEDMAIVTTWDSTDDLVSLVMAGGAAAHRVLMRPTQYGSGKSMAVVSVAGEGDNESECWYCVAVVRGGGSAWGFDSAVDGKLMWHHGSIQQGLI